MSVVFDEGSFAYAPDYGFPTMYRIVTLRCCSYWQMRRPTVVSGLELQWVAAGDLARDVMAGEYCLWNKWQLFHREWIVSGNW